MRGASGTHGEVCLRTPNVNTCKTVTANTFWIQQRVQGVLIEERVNPSNSWYKLDKSQYTRDGPYHAAPGAEAAAAGVAGVQNASRDRRDVSSALR